MTGGMKVERIGYVGLEGPCAVTGVTPLADELLKRVFDGVRYAELAAEAARLGFSSGGASRHPVVMVPDEVYRSYGAVVAEMPLDRPPFAGPGDILCAVQMVVPYCDPSWGAVVPVVFDRDLVRMKAVGGPWCCRACDTIGSWEVFRNYFECGPLVPTEHAGEGETWGAGLPLGGDASRLVEDWSDGWGVKNGWDDGEEAPDRLGTAGPQTYVCELSAPIQECVAALAGRRWREEVGGDIPAETMRDVMDGKLCDMEDAGDSHIPWWEVVHEAVRTCDGTTRPAAAESPALHRERACDVAGVQGDGRGDAMRLRQR